MHPAQRAGTLFLDVIDRGQTKSPRGFLVIVALPCHSNKYKNKQRRVWWPQTDTRNEAVNRTIGAGQSGLEAVLSYISAEGR